MLRVRPNSASSRCGATAAALPGDAGCAPVLYDRIAARPPRDPRPHGDRHLGRFLRRLAGGAFGELEKCKRVLAADLATVALADARVIEPFGRLADLFEGIVGREEDAVRSDFEDRVDERLRPKIPRGRDVEVVRKVFRDLPL